MNIVAISTTGQYPDHHAAAIRQSVLCKGLVEQGHNVRFLVLSPQSWGKKNIDYEGIRFEELDDYKGNSKLLKHYKFLRATSKAGKILKQLSQQKKIDALIVFSIMTIHTVPAYFLIKKAKTLGIKVFHERTELPYAFEANKRLTEIYLNKIVPLFDGIFVISDKIKEFMQPYNPALKKLVTVVDLDFFKSTQKSPFDFPYIGYCGNIGGDKDGVPILIESFSIISERFPGLKLVLVGDNSNKSFIAETMDAIEKFGIKDKIVFTGLVEREMMPVILCNAEIVVVAKPDNLKNSGNFPIKIGEYLATGVAVVVTSVGEIPQFIKDGESGFLAVPGSAASFAAKMEEALANKEKANAAGLKGRIVAEQNFDYKKVSAIMADYISSVLNTTVAKQ